VNSGIKLKWYTQYSEVERTWYKQRVEFLYGKLPKCPLLYSSSHLFGDCPTCGAAKKLKSALWKFVSLRTSRSYSLMCKNPEDVGHIVTVSAICPYAFTNLEYPTPVIRYNTYVHIPMFVDPINRILIDFLPDTTRSRQLINIVDKFVNDAGYGYIVYNGAKAVFKSEVLSERLRITNIISAKHAELMNILGKQHAKVQQRTA